MIQHDKSNLAFSNVLDELFNNSFHDLVGANITSSRPAVNIYDSEVGYVLEVAAPGLQKDNFDISVKDRELTVSANVPEVELEALEQIKKEYDFRNFSRRFSISEEVDTESISANYTDGLLRVSFAKKSTPAEEQVKKIVIA